MRCQRDSGSNVHGKTARVSFMVPGSGAMVKVRRERRHVLWSVSNTNNALVLLGGRLHVRSVESSGARRGKDVAVDRRDGRPAAAARANLTVCVSSRRAFVTHCAALPAQQREQRARAIGAGLAYGTWQRRDGQSARRAKTRALERERLRVLCGYS